MKQKTLIFSLCIMWGALLAPVLPAANDIGPDEAQGVSFNIRYYDKRIYFAETDPIYVQLTIANNSPAAYRFKLADERAFSIDFDIRSVNNRPLEPAEVLVRKRSTSAHVFFREITVESGESFSFVEDLRSYVNLKQPGSFIVQACVYPELYRNADSSQVQKSNRLSLNLKPPVIKDSQGVPLAFDVETNAVLARERLAPDQVVEYLLTARQKSQWEKFFLYLDLEAMISNDGGALARKWKNENATGRRKMLEDYRKELQNSVSDGDIATIPSDFTVEKTEYYNLEGTVTVLEKFKTGNYTEVKRYTYILRKKDDIWTIIDYSVVNLRTE